MIQDVGFGIKFIKDYNELKILRFIKNNKNVSRSEISKQYKISKAAVSDIVNRLINQGYVSEVGIGSSTKRGGRKPVLLNFHQKAGYVVGIEIKRAFARVALLDLNTNVYNFETIEYEKGYPIESVLNEVISIVEEYQQIPWVKKSKAIGIGVAIPGLIDYSKGCIRVSDSLKSWINVPIRKIIEEKFNIPTILENDVKTRTLSEYLFGAGKEYDNMVNLWIGDGIGAGIIIKRFWRCTFKSSVIRVCS